MAITVFWTQFAQDKLQDIFEYYKLKANQKVAGKIVDEIIKSTFILEVEPVIGQKEELLRNRKKEYRYLIIRHYKIIYWVDNNSKSVYISTVFDCRQNPVIMKNIR